MDISAPWVTGTVNNALFHSSAHISQMQSQVIHILHLRLVDLLLNYVLDFVVNWTEVMAVPLPGTS